MSMNYSRGTIEQERGGFLYALTAYATWGLFPLYFNALTGIGALEILCHRVVWSFVTVAPILVVCERFDNLRRIFHRPQEMVVLVATTALIGGNWLVFLISAEEREVLQASLGYFVGPLVSLLFGVLILRERMRALQWVSVFIVFAAVVWLAFDVGKVPWISICLAVTFALYGLLRKTVSVGPLEGLAVETVLGAIPASVYLMQLSRKGTASFLGGNWHTDLLLLFAGVMTTFPLLAFATAARRLRLITLGLMQYITPTCHFVIAVFVFEEPFSLSQLTSFCIIWLGLGLFTLDSLGSVAPR